MATVTPRRGAGTGAATGATKAASNQNRAPSPSTLSTPTRPSKASARRLTMASPRPAPPARAPAEVCSNSSKMRAWAAGSSPGPVSRTVKRTMTRPSGAGRLSAPISTPPEGVIFTALPARLNRL